VAHAEKIIESNLLFRLTAQQEGWTASLISLPDHSSQAASVNAVYTFPDFGGAHMKVVQGRTTLTEFLIACTCWSAIRPKFSLTEDPF
jgi:hypothetical protein